MRGGSSRGSKTAWRTSTKPGCDVGANERRARERVGESEGRSPADRRRPVDVRRLGRVGYADALELQKTLVDQRKQGLIPDQLLLLEHPDVITLGVRTRNDRSHVLATPETLAAEGVSVF